MTLAAKLVASGLPAYSAPMPIDTSGQRKVAQAVQRFFLRLRDMTGIDDRELVMMALAATWGRARAVGLTTAQLLEWAMKCWGACEAEEKRGLGQMIVTGSADVTRAEQDATAARLRQ